MWIVKSFFELKKGLLIVMTGINSNTDTLAFKFI